MNPDETALPDGLGQREPAAAGALSGIRVLDLSRFIAGPLCAQNLGDLGADVIKVERVGGEDTRYNEPTHNGKSIYTMMFNRNKRGMTLDVRSGRGQAILMELARWSDVIVENFRPGTLEKMGIGYETVQRINPRAVVVSISGFGQYGPARERVLFDCIAQAMSGLMDMNAGPDGLPLLTKMFPADTLAAAHATSGALAALFHRERTGVGQVVDVSVFDALVSALGTTLPGYLMTGAKPTHNGNRDDFNAPANAFPVLDGYVYVHAGTPAFWKRFCADVLGRPELSTDERFNSVPARMENVDEVEGLVAEWTSTRTGEEVEYALGKVGIPCGRVLDVAAAAHNEVVWAREMLLRTTDSDGDELVLLGNPSKLSATPVTVRLAPPQVGEHTEEVLRDVLSLSDSDIARLRTDGVV